jgi:ABC-type Fe3+ transport system permease subunit
MNTSDLRYIIRPDGKFISRYKTSCTRSNYSSVLIPFSVFIIHFYERRTLGDYTITAGLSSTADRNLKRKKIIKFLICCCFTLISLGFAHSLLQRSIITFYLRFSKLYGFDGTNSEIRNTI